MRTRHLFAYLILLLSFISLLSSLPLYAESIIELSHGQTIYVPVYSHIYSGNKERPFFLTVTLSIRNIDPKHPPSIKIMGSSDFPVHFHG